LAPVIGAVPMVVMMVVMMLVLVMLIMPERVIGPVRAERRPSTTKRQCAARGRERNQSQNSLSHHASSNRNALHCQWTGCFESQ
jgi:hypothetical protein